MSANRKPHLRRGDQGGARKGPEESPSEEERQGKDNQNRKILKLCWRGTAEEEKDKKDGHRDHRVPSKRKGGQKSCKDRARSRGKKIDRNFLTA